MFQADRRDLRVENEIATHVRLYDHFPQQRQVTFSRYKQPRRWASEQRIDSGQCISYRCRRVKHLVVRDNPHKFTNTEDWQRSGSCHRYPAWFSCMNMYRVAIYMSNWFRVIDFLWQTARPAKTSSSFFVTTCGPMRLVATAPGT